MFLSIIIPMRNEEAFVAGCLDSILTQAAGRRDVEILCVDGASSDGTGRIVRDYALRDERIRLIENPARIVPVAMNMALASARGDVIIRLDCHAKYASDYVDSCLEVLERTGADLVGGYMETLPGRDGPVGRAVAAASSSPFGVGASRFRTGGDEQEADTVPFGCFRRATFQTYGTYDERLVRNQDIELASRIRAGGGRIVLSPRIRLTYYTRSTMGGLSQQSFNNGLWNLYTVFLVGGQRLRMRHFVPLGFVLTLLGLAAGGWFWRPAWAALAGEALLYLGAGAFMAARAARKHKASTPLILAAFGVMHLSYGFGSLWGLVAGPFRRLRRTPAQALADRRE